MRSRIRRASSSLSGAACVRPVCKHGVECYRRNPDHVSAEAHPADADYLDSCRACRMDPVFVSIRKLFEWADSNGSGKVTRENLQQVWAEIQRIGKDIGPLDDALWHELDDDGNGHINFSEFAEFTTQKKIELPLGLDDLFDSSNAGGFTLKCGVFECDCTGFRELRRKCKYGSECYQKSEEHRSSFAHPDDEDWTACVGPGGKEMCRCGHKKKLHASSACGADAVPYPDYWSHASGAGRSSSSTAPGGASSTTPVDASSEFMDLLPVPDEIMVQLQLLVDSTYSDVTTRDRQRHSGSWMVPRGFEVQSVRRNENSKLWRKYCVRKAELQKEKLAIHGENPDAAWQVHRDVKTTEIWEAYGGRLDTDINEWYLWHGTSASAAENICRSDFKMRLAGSATGTLYGRGAYLAESITKADEYSKVEDSYHTVLLCRVLGGRVRYCDERTPDPDGLTKDCTEGDFDCILGDRIKTSGTYREFILFDTENVYPEYIVKYTRGELFKSRSHP